MRLEDQVVSLESAKKLKELGVAQESAFSWMRIELWPDKKIQYILWPRDRANGTHPKGDPSFIEAAAFTVAELGELMKDKGLGVTAHSNLIIDEWWVTGGVWKPENQKFDHLEKDKSWSDALAKMLIYLLENGLIKDKTLTEGV